MNKNLIGKITAYIEEHIGEYHQSRIDKLSKMDLKKLLARKNPYMYKAKALLTAGDMVNSLASAFMSSAEETLFGDWLEQLAIFVNSEVYKGTKSSATGVDLEFDKDGVHYFVSIKSGPNWSNSSSLKKQKENFLQAKRVYNTSRKTRVATQAIEGCCYGNDNKSYADSDHEKYCGEKFWTFISGEPTLFVDIIDPLGSKAKEKNDEYAQNYVNMVNKFTAEFIKEYCNKKTGAINWEKLVRFNSGEK